MRVAGPNPNTAYTRSSALTKRSNVFVSKSGCTSIRCPPDNTTASPQLGSCCVGDFLAANSTGTNRPNWPAEEAALLFLFQRCFFRCRFSVPKLKPRLRQNSLRRMPLVTNSATICRTSARVRRLGATNFFSMVIELLQHRHDSAKQVCWSNAYASPKLPACLRLRLSGAATAQVIFSGGAVRAAHLDRLAKYFELAKLALGAEEEE